MPAEYIMVGGFLGAGKTTALLALAGRLTAKGLRVGLITNDQSHGLVDTALVDAHGYPVQEITGGCFCCRFDSLIAAAERLGDRARPDVFLAEPVGSCTDLRASVQYPLRRLYGEDFRVAPLTVLVDPIRAERILGIEPGGSFSSKVLYVYGKQLEEADLIAINKGDLLAPDRRARLEAALARAYPAAQILMVSARLGTGIDDWLERLTGGTAGDRPAPDVDYDEYAEGEALLGWCNGAFRVHGAETFDGNVLLADFAHDVRRRLVEAGLEIAHLKMTLTPDEDAGDLAALNLVSSDREPELSHRLVEGLASGELLVNLRAEGDPDVLRAVVASALDGAVSRREARSDLIHLEHFRPAKPTPTHRMATVSG